MRRNYVAVIVAAGFAVGLVGISRPPRAEAVPRAKAEAQILRCVNRERAEAGLTGLVSEASLSLAARYHAKNMASHDFFDHIDPWGDGPTERVALFDDRDWLVGENIGAGYRNGRAACRGWMNSAGHRANILDPDYGYLGVGFAKGGSYGTYYVQDFGILNETPPPPTPLAP